MTPMNPDRRNSKICTDLYNPRNSFPLAQQTQSQKVYARSKAVSNASQIVIVPRPVGIHSRGDPA